MLHRYCSNSDDELTRYVSQRYTRNKSPRIVDSKDILIKSLTEINNKRTNLSIDVIFDFVILIKLKMLFQLKSKLDIIRYPNGAS